MRHVPAGAALLGRFRQQSTIVVSNHISCKVLQYLRQANAFKVRAAPLGDPLAPILVQRH